MHCFVGIQSLRVPLVSIGVLGESILEEPQLLLHGGVAYVSGLLLLSELLGQPALLRLGIVRQASIDTAQTLELLAMPLRVLVQQALQAIQPLLHRRVMGLGLRPVVVVVLLQPRHRRSVLLARRQPAVQCVGLGLGLLDGLAVPLRRVPNEGLEIVHPLLQRGVRGLQHGLLRSQARLGALEVSNGRVVPFTSRDPRVHLIHLRVRRRQVALVRVPLLRQALLEVAQPLFEVQSRVLRVRRLHAPHLFHVLGVRGSEGLDLAAVFIRGVAERLLEELDALLHRGVLRLQRRLLPRQARVALLQLTHGAAEALACSDTACHVFQLGVGCLQRLGVAVRRVPQHVF
mmetsp:Transcript_32533/g.82229  ORF Transcript_32533/g.82229 Transcript_32533/m.82229 type:complete len:345 (-) Transcript_32533:941-1975(-)